MATVNFSDKVQYVDTRPPGERTTVARHGGDGSVHAVTRYCRLPLCDTDLADVTFIDYHRRF